ncbi:MAG: zinc metallopeptidase [Gammaproteobacteria bacterium]
MLPVIAGLLFTMTLLFAPQLWVKYVLKKYSTPLPQLPGSGGELAEHLLGRLGFADTKTILTEQGDHYDPAERSVCLSESTFHDKSLTAVVIAAHEVGHAIQHHNSYKPMLVRAYLARCIGPAEKLAGFILISSPFAALLSKQPLLGGLMLLSGMVLLFLPVVFHLITLPVEWDASFNRALPILMQGQYLPADSEPIVRRILTAATLTYLSASLFSLLNFYRWLVFLRR